jgi:hypothetical protein
MVIGLRAGDAPHRVIGLWAVVVRGGVFIRSWRVSRDGWFHSLLREPYGLLVVGRRRVRVRAVRTRGERLKMRSAGRTQRSTTRRAPWPTSATSTGRSPGTPRSSSGPGCRPGAAPDAGDDPRAVAEFCGYTGKAPQGRLPFRRSSRLGVLPVIRVEVPVPSRWQSSSVISAVERACAAEGLALGMRTTLATVQGSVHWHFRKATGAGTLEITWSPQDRRLWLQISGRRGAPWVALALQRVRRQILRLAR